MKPKFFFIALLLTGLSIATFAQNSSKARTTVRFSESITSLTVDDDMTVVLTEGTAPGIVVEGDARDISATLNDGHLTLSALARHSVVNTKVYVPAALLSRIYLNGASVLNSASTLSNRTLKIYMLAEAKVHVESTGNVTVETSDDIRFVKGR